MRILLLVVGLFVFPVVQLHAHDFEEIVLRECFVLPPENVISEEKITYQSPRSEDIHRNLISLENGSLPSYNIRVVGKKIYQFVELEASFVFPYMIRKTIVIASKNSDNTISLSGELTKEVKDWATFREIRNALVYTGFKKEGQEIVQEIERTASDILVEYYDNFPFDTKMLIRRANNSYQELQFSECQ